MTAARRTAAAGRVGSRNWLEWLVLVASIVAVLGLVGYLALQALVGGGPADVRLEPADATAARATDAGWVTPVTVRNAGGEAAANVVVEATATVDGAQETARLVLELLPSGSVLEIALVFSGRPDGDVRLRVAGYETP